MITKTLLYDIEISKKRRESRKMDSLDKIMAIAISHDPNLRRAWENAGILTALFGPMSIRQKLTDTAFYSYAVVGILPVDVNDMLMFGYKAGIRLVYASAATNGYEFIIGCNMDRMLQIYRRMIDVVNTFARLKRTYALKLTKARTLKFDTRRFDSVAMSRMKKPESINFALLIITYILSRYGKYDKKTHTYRAFVKGNNIEYLMEIIKNYFFNMYGVILTESRRRSIARTIWKYINDWAKVGLINIKKIRTYMNVANGIEYAMDFDLFNNLYKLALWDTYRKTAKFVKAVDVFKKKLAIDEWFDEVPMSQKSVVNMYSSTFYRLAHMAFLHPAALCAALYKIVDKYFDKYAKMAKYVDTFTEVLSKKIKLDKRGRFTTKGYLVIKDGMLMVETIDKSVDLYKLDNAKLDDVVAFVINNRPFIAKHQIVFDENNKRFGRYSITDVVKYLKQRLGFNIDDEKLGEYKFTSYKRFGMMVNNYHIMAIKTLRNFIIEVQKEAFKFGHKLDQIGNDQKAIDAYFELVLNVNAEKYNSKRACYETNLRVSRIWIPTYNVQVENPDSIKYIDGISVDELFMYTNGYDLMCIEHGIGCDTLKNIAEWYLNKMYTLFGQYIHAAYGFDTVRYIAQECYNYIRVADMHRPRPMIF